MGQHKKQTLDLKYQYIPDESLLYIKKKKHSSKKSDHKHIYEPVVFEESEKGLKSIGKGKCQYHPGTRCKICGKIGDFLFLWNNEQLKKFNQEYNGRYIQTIKLPESFDCIKDKYI